MVLSGTGLNAQPFWNQLTVPTTSDLSRLSFVDSLHGWIVGDNGVILKTNDGGQHWTIQSSGMAENMVDIFMLNARQGWALAHSFTGDSAGTFILKTSNSGEVWAKSFYPVQYKYFFSLYFLDSLNGWMAGKSGELVGTSDGGQTWFSATIDSSSNRLYWDLFKVKFFSPQVGIALGGRFDLTGVFWRTTNGGQTWITQTFGSEPLFDCVFLDSLNAVGVGGDYEFGASVFRTSDGGATWDYRWLGLFGQGRAISFRTPLEAWAPLGFSGAYMYTFDGGETWTQKYLPGGISEFIPGPLRVYGVQFTDRKTGYMIGDSGLVYKYDYFTSPVKVFEKWNIVSLPLKVLNQRKEVLFPSAVSDAYAFTESGYEQKDTLLNGYGYWLKFPDVATYELEGLPLSTDTFTVRAGWNIIGSISSPVHVSSVLSEPPNNIASSFFAYHDGYFAVDTLHSGKGYWVKVHNEGRLIVNATER
jgi:photosystem II stability/assembly factor-like uncharacterized protein